MRALVRRLIARAMALGRPGLGSRTRELAGDVPRARSSVPSHARPTLACMDLTPHLTRLPAPTAGAPRAGFVRRLRARLTGSSRGHLAGSPRARLAGSLRARLARACDPVWRTAATPDTNDTPLPARLPVRDSHDTRRESRLVLTNLSRRSPSSRRPSGALAGVLARTRAPTPTLRSKAHLSPSHSPLQTPNTLDQQNHPM